MPILRNRKKPEQPKGNDKFIEFVNKQLGLMEKGIENYLQEQNDLPVEEITLLKVKDLIDNDNEESNTGEGDEEEEENSTSKEELNQRLDQINQQIELLTKLTESVKSDLHLDELASEKAESLQLRDNQLKALQEKYTKYKNLRFNIDYQIEGNDNSGRSVYFNERHIFKRFVYPPMTSKSTLNVYTTSADNLEFNNYAQKVSKTKKDFKNAIFNINAFKDESEYYKFDDFIQTLKIISSTTFDHVVMSIQLDNNLSLLATLRVLLSLKSFNTIMIRPVYSRSEEQLGNISGILEAIFKVILSQRNLQSLTIE